MRERSLAAALATFTTLAGALVLVPDVAYADAGKDAAEIVALEAQIAAGARALSAGGCGVACRALSSMERAADRICALDPGPRCAAARAKVKEATRRVQEACAECKSALEEAPPPVRAAEPPPPATASPKPAPPADRPEAPHAPGADEAAPAPMAAEVQKRGGCAGCAVGGEDGRTGAAIAAALVLAACARRRARARPRA